MWKTQPPIRWFSILHPINTLFSLKGLALLEFKVIVLMKGPIVVAPSMESWLYFTTTFRSKIRRKNPTARGFLFLNLPKITRIHFFFVNVATSVGEAMAILITVG